MADTSPTYEQIQEAADFIKGATNTTARVAVITGAALGELGSNLTDATTLPYDTIPNFPSSKSTVGRVIAGNIGDTSVVIMQGRYHRYDGYTMQECTMYVRVLKLLGVENVIIINVSGGINESYKVGDIMLIKDHVNLLGFSGQNPLMGLNEDRFGPRYFPLSKAYDKELLSKAKEVLDAVQFEGKVYDGVYAAVSGAAYDTLSENVLLKTCGIDAVGATIVPEVMVAKHCNMGVLAIALITDEGVTNEEQDKEIDHDEMIATCQKRSAQLNDFLQQFLSFAATYEAPKIPVQEIDYGPDEDAQLRAGDDAGTAAEVSTAGGAEADAVSAGTKSTATTANAATLTNTCCRCKRT